MSYAVGVSAPFRKHKEKLIRAVRPGGGKQGALRKLEHGIGVNIHADSFRKVIRELLEGGLIRGES